ncbi:oxidoreductase [Pseudomaricurvus sp. HS19]|uniref:oxidoreductase n=1 Tax=Pseudomaricurvus sp. HS19 TaxID=2692626 RepID=UPI00136ED11C|nr:oxidoreductase [Pseudomaricurvus sp. HS19]MYM62294.1 SDR family NAD(P)-dependent oxidoreductase [Pseudomaricurvus sp. HS19]
MPDSRGWSVADMADQSGRIAIVTGASSGIGLEAARALAAKGAEVILAVRDAAKGSSALRSITDSCPGAEVSMELLDLADLGSVQRFARYCLTRLPKLDLLIDNAGVMMSPYATTSDGFELQMGTNHLGHFALTLQLLPLLRNTPGSRIVVVSSLAHHRGNPDFDDLNWQLRGYDTVQAYCDSKLANLWFVQGLVQRLQGEEAPQVTAAHPGWTRTELQRHSLKYRLLGLFMAQDTASGALPTLRATVDPEAQSGDFYGPGGKKQMKGPAVKVVTNPAVKDGGRVQQLWQLSEALTGVRYD